MKRNIILSLLLVLICNALFGQIEVQQVEKLKAEAAAEVEKYAVLGQQINDMLFSFSELGFQEYETFNYLTSLLEKQGFKVEKGIAGVPTAWIATWGSGKPVYCFRIRRGLHSEGLTKAWCCLPGPYRCRWHPVMVKVITQGRH
jgi:aminobenzoyl-glutamate utilization protein B